jgi:transketolase
MRDAFAQRLLERAAADDKIMFLTGDLGFGVFEQFQSKLPRQYLNVGVAEQNMVAVASGLALEGYTCFVYSIGNFPTLRCLEQIRNDAAYHGANVKVVSIGGGFSYGPLGMSHHATEDIAIMSAIPGVACFTPGTVHDVVNSVDALIEAPGTGYLRLDKSAGHESSAAEPFVVGRWRIMRPGDDVTVVAVGGVLDEAQKASAALEDCGISAAVVSATQPSPIDREEVIRTLGAASVVVSVEEHVVRGGIGGIVAEAMAESASPARLVRHGVRSSFVSAVGSQTYLRRDAGLDAEALVDTVLAALGSRGDSR